MKLYKFSFRNAINVNAFSWVRVGHDGPLSWPKGKFLMPALIFALWQFDVAPKMRHLMSRSSEQSKEECGEVGENESVWLIWNILAKEFFIN